MRNLAITVLGNRNSGKSETWNHLFERIVRTGIKRFYFNDKEYVEVFLISGSSEERGIYIGDILGRLRPRIVFCSMQYTQEVNQTIQFLNDNDYFIFCHWLNPGYSDANRIEAFDKLGLMNLLLSIGSTVGIRNGRISPYRRTKEMRDYVWGWSNSRNLILRDEN